QREPHRVPGRPGVRLDHAAGARPLRLPARFRYGVRAGGRAPGHVHHRQPEQRHRRRHDQHPDRAGERGALRRHREGHDRRRWQGVRVRRPERKVRARFADRATSGRKRAARIDRGRRRADLHGRATGRGRAHGHRSRSRRLARPHRNQARVRSGESQQQSLAMDTLKTRPRTLAIAAAGLIVLAAAIGLWSVSRRLPVAETHRFLTGPVEVGETPPPAPVAPASQASVAERFAEARTAFQEGRYPEAATAFAWVASQDPAGPDAGAAQWNLTRSRLRSGDASGALSALEDLLRHYAGYLGEQAPAMGEGLAAMNRNDLQAAQAAFERMTREQPDSEFVPLAWALVARIHWAHGEAMETVQAFSRMFASVHDAVPAYARLAHQLDRYAKGE